LKEDYKGGIIMYEYHGWVTIRPTPKHINNEEEDMLWEFVRKSIEGKIKTLDWITGLVNLQWVNGSCQINVSGSKNRRSVDSEGINELYQYIAKVASVSYGLLYEWDDEDLEGFENKFKVKVLKRGKIIEVEDNLLSPIIPEIEGEYVV
jgi:hypothetical protein